MATKIELNNLLESVGRNLNLQAKAARFGTDPFTDTIGYHIYGELNLNLKLTAAEETSDAEKLIKILQEYTAIGEACAAESQATLLEVQGERIHFLLPRSIVNADSIAEVIRFSNAFTNAVYFRISKTAGKEFNGFRMAVDHGRAILISSGVQANGSIVSLGPAANTPAKEMKRNGSSGTLRMRTAFLRNISTDSPDAGWINLPVREPSAEIKNIMSSDLSQRVLNRSEEFARAATQDRPTIIRESADYFKTFTGGYVNRAVKVRGFALRADLDGFSKEVEEAFKKGDSAIAELIRRFINILRYPEQFRTKIGKTIDLPFAGDCATVVVLPGDANYSDAREYLPVKVAAEWHSQRSGEDVSKRRWVDYLGKTKWAVGIAGGDEHEGSDGYILIAPITGRSRDFLVAAGWSVGRSLDAQETEGASGGDTVIPKVDYLALASTHRTNFKELNTIFWISHDINPGRIRSGGAAMLAATPTAYTSRITQPVPQPRPHYG